MHKNDLIVVAVAAAYLDVRQSSSAQRIYGQGSQLRAYLGVGRSHPMQCAAEGVVVIDDVRSTVSNASDSRVSE